MKRKSVSADRYFIALPFLFAGGSVGGVAVLRLVHYYFPNANWISVLLGTDPIGNLVFGPLRIVEPLSDVVALVCAGSFLWTAEELLQSARSFPLGFVSGCLCLLFLCIGVTGTNLGVGVLVGTVLWIAVLPYIRAAQGK